MTTTITHKYAVGERVGVNGLHVGCGDGDPLAGTILRLLPPQGVFAAVEKEPCYVLKCDHIDVPLGFPESALWRMDESARWERDSLILDNGDGSGWHIDPDGLGHPLASTADGWELTGGQPLPPDPNPHPVNLGGAGWPPVNRPGSGVLPTD